jgi:hypothetical protein
MCGPTTRRFSTERSATPTLALAREPGVFPTVEASVTVVRSTRG